jgi:hypothetical protein
VELFQRDIFTDSLEWIDEYSFTGGNNQYSFMDVPAGVYYLKARADSASMYFGDYFPTYYRNDLFWYESNAVQPCDTNQFYRDIFLIPSSDSLIGGNVEIDGIVVDDDVEETRMTNLDLILKKIGHGFVRHTTTNEQGHFSFSALSPGTYEIHVDFINSQVFNLYPPLIDLQNSIGTKWILTDTALIFDELLVNAIKLPNSEMDVIVWPNPSHGSFNVDLNNLEGGMVKIEVLNNLGQQLIQKKISTSGNRERFSIDVKPGHYFLVIEHNGQQKIKKIIQME